VTKTAAVKPKPGRKTGAERKLVAELPGPEYCWMLMEEEDEEEDEVLWQAVQTVVVVVVPP